MGIVHLFEQLWGIGTVTTLSNIGLDEAWFKKIDGRLQILPKSRESSLVSRTVTR